MRISIAMTTYNGAKYLRTQLDSFRNQERLPDELVICDDGSTDDTVTILQDFQQTAPFTVIVEGNAINLGFTKNFEKSVSLCTGDIVFLSDQDDVWYPDKIKQVEKLFIDNPSIALIIHDGDIVDGNLVSNNVTLLQQVKNGYGNDDVVVTGCLTAIRGLFLQYVLPIPTGIIGHDVWFHKIARLLNTRLVLNQSLQSIRRHGDNTSNWVASSNKQINKFDVFMNYLSTKPAENYDDRLLINAELKKVLKKIMTHESLFSTQDIENGLVFLEAELKSISKRQHLLKENFVMRRISALQLLLSGNYRHFNGINSFFRDLLR